MRLHLGCGHQYKEGWINIEAPNNELCYDDIKADVRARIEDLNYEENSVDEILMEAVLEHFPRHIAILQLRKFCKWLKPGGKLTVLVPDFWGTVSMLRKSRSVQERQFWYRCLFGPQDTIQYGTHFDGFDVDKLKYMFSIVGFSKFDYEIIKRWPNIRFTGIKDGSAKSDDEVTQNIVKYMSYYEAREETGIAFKAWMDAMNIASAKPETEDFYTQRLYRRPTVTQLIKKVLKKLTA